MNKQDIVNNDEYHSKDNPTRDIEWWINRYYNEKEREEAIEKAKTSGKETMQLKEEVGLAFEEAIEEDKIRDNNKRNISIINNYPFLKDFVEQYWIENLYMDNPDTTFYKLLEKWLIRNFWSNDYHWRVFFVVDSSWDIKEVPHREEYVNLENKNEIDFSEEQAEYEVISKEESIKDYISNNSMYIITFNMDSMENLQSASVLPL